MYITKIEIRGGMVFYIYVMSKKSFPLNKFLFVTSINFIR